jgi:hypothetical protein
MKLMQKFKAQGKQAAKCGNFEAASCKTDLTMEYPLKVGRICAS